MRKFCSLLNDWNYFSLTLINPALLYGNILIFQILIRFISSPYSLPQCFLINSFVPRLVWGAQALEKVNMSPKLRKMSFFAQNGYFFWFSFFGEIQFSQKNRILTHSKNQPHTLAQHVLTQQIPNPNCCYYKLPRSGPHEVRYYREVRYRKNKLKVWRKGRAATGAHLIKMKAQYQTFQTHCTLIRVVVEILMI